ncbi:hypothetical protein V1525DRAFT_418525 [Lipomyces kononenkoae]|uniref:Uncharacterized protein n=1 Tax=Lipomyces kononenkoae TaxID=34357 RepID=A0ACC3T4D5_LIPKO
MLDCPADIERPRSRKFHSLRHQPYQGHHSLRLLHSHVNGPVSWLNPTRARFAYDTTDPLATPLLKDVEEYASEKRKTDRPSSHLGGITFEWRSRNNRKGRSVCIVKTPRSEAESKEPRVVVPQSTASLHNCLRNIGLMFIYFPYWDISYLVAFLFTIGSVIWVINGFFAWLPLQDPSTELKDESLWLGVTAFVGATVFEVGSVLLVLEAINVNREGCFGWAVELVFQGHGEVSNYGQLKFSPQKDDRDHHYRGSYVSGRPQSAKSSSVYTSSNELDAHAPPQSWQWLPSLHDLRTHLLHELGFLASISQLVGATIFWISGFTALPGINNKLSQDLLDGVYWTPQIVGGMGFVVSSALFMLETQRNWYTPAPRSLGWHIGLWNLVGSFGFTLCGALGPAYANGGAQYQSSLATFWGSWAFLIASVIQWYESLGKWVVEHR